MASTTGQKPWWRRRRIWWPLAAGALMTAALVVAVGRSGESRVMICNETGATIPDLTVTVCGQQATFTSLEDGGSARFTLQPTGGESEIALFTNGVSTPFWHGDYVEPSGGYRAIVHLQRNGEVVCHTSLSWWQATSFGRGVSQ